MDQLVSEATAERRFQTLLLSVFSGIALVLSLVGLYALVAYSVRQRTAEIGIRMALGAQRRDILRLVIRQGAALTFAGVPIGLLGSSALSRLLANLLFEVSQLTELRSRWSPLSFAALHSPRATSQLGGRCASTPWQP